MNQHSTNGPQEPEVVTEQALPKWLLERVPAIADRFARESDGWPPPISAYFMLSFVLKRHFEDTLDRGDYKEVQRIFDILEHLANRGDAQVKNELVVTMEEVEIWKVWQFLGPTMREDQWAAVAWFPERKDRNTRANEHVDPKRYRQRWREEIERIGGFQNLTPENELFIRYKLVREFDISGLRAPQPGGEEWLGMGLPWPYEAAKPKD